MTSLIFVSLYSQTVDSLIVKLSNKICIEIGEIEQYSDFSDKFDACYDKAMRGLVADRNLGEIRLIANKDSLSKINNNIIPYMMDNCEMLKLVISKELEKPDDGVVSFPTDFNEKKLKKAKKHPDRWNGKIVAFEAKIIEVYSKQDEMPIYKVRIGEQFLIVSSAVRSGFEEKGSHIRTFGYLLTESINEMTKSEEITFLAIAVLDLRTEQLAYVPGSIMQVKQWINGQIPTAKKD